MTYPIKRYEYLDDNTRISIVEWSQHDYSVQTQYNHWVRINPNWDNVGVLDERELGSSMQVYGYIQEMISEYMQD